MSGTKTSRGDQLDPMLAVGSAQFLALALWPSSPERRTAPRAKSHGAAAEQQAASTDSAAQVVVAVTTNVPAPRVVWAAFVGGLFILAVALIGAFGLIGKSANPSPGPSETLVAAAASQAAQSTRPKSSATSSSNSAEDQHVPVGETPCLPDFDTKSLLVTTVILEVGLARTVVLDADSGWTEIHPDPRMCVVRWAAERTELNDVLLGNELSGSIGADDVADSSRIRLTNVVDDDVWFDPEINNQNPTLCDVAVNEGHDDARSYVGAVGPFQQVDLGYYVRHDDSIVRVSCAGGSEYRFSVWSASHDGDSIQRNTGVFMIEVPQN